MIYVRLHGGLGNQMFQYALGRVLSLKNKTELLFNIEAYEDKTERPFKGVFMNVRDFQLDVFNISGRVALSKEIPWQYRMYGKGKISLIFDAVRRRIIRHKAQELYFSNFNPKMLELSKNSYLDGFFMSPKYFVGYEDVIRNDFTLKNQPANHIQSLIQEVKGQKSLCVHIRRGDYVNNPDHETITSLYYKNAFEYISNKTHIDAVYVFSDDIEWCRDNMSFPIKTVFVGREYNGEKDEGGLMIMSACSHFIISNSTFAWWAVWLNTNSDKIVVAPKDWFPSHLGYNSNDLVPAEWARM